MDRDIFIPCEDFALEACISEGSKKSAAALLCHPHPLYGGDMYNTVVMAMKNGFSRAGFGVLRFNFRGVGKSGGVHGGGDREVFDVISCYNFLKKKGVEDVWLGGYSFGAWVALKSLMDDNAQMNVKGLVMVAPPVNFLDFSRLSVPSLPVLIVSGSSDQLCNLENLRSWIGGRSVELVVVKNADHFFLHGLSEIEAAISNFVAS